MSDSVDIKKRIPLYTFLLVGIAICLSIAFTFVKNLSKETVVSTISYNESIGDEYKVTYQENDFYTKPYYTISDSPYLGNLVDTIEVDFDYYLYYSNEVYGNYNYKIMGELVVFEPGNENDPIWTKEYILSDTEEESFSSKDYRIQKNITINYQDYLNEYKAYARLSKVSSNAKFVIKYEVINKATYNSLPEINTKSFDYVSIPLTETTFKISKKTNITEERKTVNNSVKNYGDNIFDIIVIALCVLLGIVLFLIILLVNKNDHANQSLYSKTVKKIITTYDNILVRVTKLPDTKGLNAINVTSFDELVDAQSEVRLPINYMEDTKKKTVKFILIRNDMAWIYTLKEGDLEDEKKA